MQGQHLKNELEVSLAIKMGNRTGAVPQQQKEADVDNNDYAEHLTSSLRVQSLVLHQHGVETQGVEYHQK